MKQLDHKLVCWGDYAIPARLDDNWLAWDVTGLPWTYKNRPHKRKKTGVWDASGRMGRIAQDGVDTIPPPEPGSWDTQLYWIG